MAGSVSRTGKTAVGFLKHSAVCLSDTNTVDSAWKSTQLYIQRSLFAVLKWTPKKVPVRN